MRYKLSKHGYKADYSQKYLQSLRYLLLDISLMV